MWGTQEPVRIRLYLKNLHLPVRIGWHGHEREVPRPLVLNLTFDVAYEVDPGLEGTVDLEGAATVVLAFSGQEFRLMEDLALAIGRRLLEAYGRLQRVSVHVSKPAPPGVACLDAACIEAVLERDG